MGRTGDTSCQGRYKVSKNKAFGVDVYWRHKFVEDGKGHQQEIQKKRKEEADQWQVKKFKDDEKQQEIIRSNTAFHMEEARRREARRKLDQDQQKLKSLAQRLKEIEGLTRELSREVVRGPDLYDPEFGHRYKSELNSKDPRFIGLRQEWSFLLDEYNSLLHSIETRINR